MRRDPTNSEALFGFEQIVGSPNVVLSGSEITLAETATFTTSQKIIAIVRPACVSEVQACMRFAGERRIPIYPVSMGKNWGLGSRVPVRDGAVVMELKRLDRITNLDVPMAHVTVEPGVTFQKLYDYLANNAPSLMMDGTGSTPFSSIIGNTVERGHGSGPYGERLDHVCGLEVVLPNGECIHTGHARYEKAATARLHRWGSGPLLDGLFTQSNFGIVTRMTMFLMPTAQHFQSYFFDIKDHARLANLVDAMRGLRLLGLTTTFRVFND